MLAGHLAVGVHVIGCAFWTSAIVEFDQAVRQLVELGQHGWFHRISVDILSKRGAGGGRGERGMAEMGGR
jgi:hypothetical protein